MLARIKAAWRAFNGYHMQEWSPDRRYWVNQSQPARKDIPYGVRQRILDWSREFERKDAIFNRYLALCEQYIVGPTGLRIVSASSDKAFQLAANAEWDYWQQLCDISTRFSFGQRQSLIERDVQVAGGIFIYLTFGDTGKPRIQLIPSENVETPKDKRAQDATIFDGVRFDPVTDRALGYFVKTGDSSWNEVPADKMVHIFDPSRVGQLRELPTVYPVLKDLIDLEELQDLEMIAAKDAARVSKVITTATGEMPATSLRRSALRNNTVDAGGNAVANTKAEYYKTAVKGESVLLQTGDTYQQFESNRPSVAVQTFWDYVSARAGAGLGLPIEILIMRSLQGTMTRAALDMANSFFRCGSASRAEHFGRIWQHVILNSKLRGNLPSDFAKIRYTPPRAINVDVGRNSAALVNEFKTGFRTLESIVAETGQDWREVLEQRAAELAYAKELEANNGLIEGSVLQTVEPLPPPPEPTATDTNAS